MNDVDIKNWMYLVAAVQNPQGQYVNARATRYARAIIAANEVIKTLDIQPTVQPEAAS